MKSLPPGNPAEPFFLKTDLGTRFYIYHPPGPGTKCRGGILYAHPFGDEMNKARRMAALQARTLAAMGFGVLQLDLFGCGDSSGEFSDARWQIWKQDLATAMKWITARLAAPVSLWGLRLGGMLLLDFVRSFEPAVERIVLWQPVVDGKLFLTQFLRLRLANEMLAGKDDSVQATGTNAMHASLDAGNMLEVAGYALAPELAAAIGALKANELAIKKIPIHWFEIVAAPGRAIVPAAAKVIKTWEENDVDVDVHIVSGTQFWATQEIAECAELVAATASIFAEKSP